LEPSRSTLKSTPSSDKILLDARSSFGTCESTVSQVPRVHPQRSLKSRLLMQSTTRLSRQLSGIRCSRRPDAIYLFV
jgi:hypothetical protein